MQGAMAMGRNKRRTSENSNIPTELEEAWPASPTRPPRYVLYCHNHATGRDYVVNSRALYAARKLYDRLTLDQDDINIRGDMASFGEIDVRSDQLPEILDYEYSELEKAWELPSPYPSQIHLFLSNRRIREETEVTGTKVPPASRAPVAKKKVDRTGKTSIQDIAAEMKVHPRDARAVLRKAKMQKPSYGWLFDEKEIEEIKKIIQSNTRRNSNEKNKDEKS